MNRIQSIFLKLRAARGKALMPFITAGHPSVQATAATLVALDGAGAAICELGIPFSDPVADGPVIQASMTDALKAGATPENIFEAVAGVRSQLGMGLVAMVSYSIVYRMGVKQFVGRAAKAGFDGFIFPDLPLEEAEAVTGPVRDAGLISSLLISPTTPPKRVEQIARASTGFVYVIARTGITGERAALPEGLDERLTNIRNVTDLPIAVGFGISTPEHVRAVTRIADAAIVGSALVRLMGDPAASDPDQVASNAAKFVSHLATGLQTNPTTR